MQSSLADFWPDVFVRHKYPWKGLLQSVACHGVAFVLLLAFARLFSLQPRVVTPQKFDHSEVVYYQGTEYLPPLDTRQPSVTKRETPDPELSKQPIISVPPEADNRLQTIVTPPKVRLKHDVALPNIVAWSDDDKKPRLAIPEVPLTPAADITRIAPRMDEVVVAPAPDSARLRPQRSLPVLQSAVVAPPPELRAANSSHHFQRPQPELIAPPPSVGVTSARRLGQMNIAPSAVIAPAPQLPVAAQRAVPGGRLGSGTITAQVVPPPPPVSSAGSSSASFGARGHVIALGLHPAVGAPPAAPAGNRRGALAATPEGHAGATGSPGSTSSDGLRNGSGGSAQSAREVPSGLYVGKAPGKPSSIAGTPAGESASSVNPALLADGRPPRIATSPHSSESTAKLSEAERAVFSGRKFYSLTLNMPNLNSAVGSWVVHFAEANHDSGTHNDGPAADISQPVATRKVDPAYPMELMRENVAGTVILYAVIRSDGTVGNIRVLRGVDDRLDRFASQAVARWKFEPATKNGVPVDVEATFQIPFRPSRAGTSF